ncbi:hypothetical protein [Nocardioides sp. zg-1228]|uniref:hypothetical protein n=1 Tax=Nocardioides sp. zg-1228 TaxID=2763008 RepID=UPI0016435A35|nr:hypothetical protein [Nocardioides sp. zg-1228]MBC2932243.1 hypothetical protein [Nocardioides sp. zg-1228]QSF57770.1 hypothetical protein JX575_00555 [Nocardioides sp. zg-1228]
MTWPPEDSAPDPAPDPAAESAEGQDDEFLAFTGDQASAARLRANLISIAEDHPGTGVEAVVGEVLAGRRPIRDLADDPEFSDVIAVGMDDYRRYLSSLTADERAEMVADAKHTTSPRT